MHFSFNIDNCNFFITEMPTSSGNVTDLVPVGEERDWTGFIPCQIVIVKFKSVTHTKPILPLYLCLSFSAIYIIILHSRE